MINAYCTGHKWSVLVCNAFAAGAKCPIVPPSPLLAGDVFMYGALRGLLPTYWRAKREGRALLYGDNGYLHPGKADSSYFRITRNALQCDGSTVSAAHEPLLQKRWSALGVALQPWRTSGAHIVVCPPGRLFGATFGFDADAWMERVMEELPKHTDRELRVRAKVSWNDAKAPSIVGQTSGIVKTSVVTDLADDLKNAWALVTHSSNAAVEALVAGVPVFCTDLCGSSAMGLSDLSLIESPRTDGDRERWGGVLACNQWSLIEMRSGDCWRMLCEIA